MATRLELLTAFAALDTATLARLLPLADTIIVPDADTLTKVTFTDMVAKAHILADTYFPEWTDRSKADFGEFLIELYALFSEKDFYYANSWANEAFLHTAKLYSNVYNHAMRLGYRPTRHQSSDAPFTLVWTQGVTSVLVSPGDIEVTLADGSVFTNGDLITIPAGGATYSMARLLYSGKYTTATAIFNGRSAIIQGQAVDYRSVRMSIGSTVWTQVQSFADSDANSTVFMVLATDGEEMEIVFGMGGYGARPAVGEQLTFQFRQQVKGDSNPALQSATVSKNTSGNLLVSATMLIAARHAAMPESIEEIRANASLMSATRGNNCVRNHYDAVAMLQAMPEVQVAGAVSFARKLYITAHPKVGVSFSVAELQEFANRLAPVTIDGFVLEPQVTVYETISDITFTAYVLDSFDADDIEQQIRDYHSFITNPMQGAQYGVGYDMGVVLQAMLAQIEGLSNVVWDTINGVTAANIALLPLSIFEEIDPSNLTITIIQIAGA